MRAYVLWVMVAALGVLLAGGCIAPPDRWEAGVGHGWNQGDVARADLDYEETGVWVGVSGPLQGSDPIPDRWYGFNAPLLPLEPTEPVVGPEPHETAPAPMEESAGAWWENESFLAWLERVLLLALGALGLGGAQVARRKMAERG